MEIVSNTWNQNPILRIVVFMAILETLWFSIMKSVYQTRLNMINMGMPTFTYRSSSIILVYILLIFGINHYIISQFKDQVPRDIRTVMSVAIPFALIVYGIYNLTNYSIMFYWDYYVSTMDLLWGICMITAVSYLVLNF